MTKKGRALRFDKEISRKNISFPDLHPALRTDPHSDRAVFQQFKDQGKMGRIYSEMVQQPFQNEQIMNALYTTLIISLLASVIATVIGTAAAIAIHGMKQKWRTYIPD